LVCIIDTSGSMTGDKLDLVKSSLKFCVEQLSKNDRLSVITFSTNVEVEFEFIEMNDKGKKRAIELIEKIYANSLTNLSGGLFKGFDILENKKEYFDVTSLLLFTDGLANVGIQST
jgi:uncharacterized protein with von Willebrand factor type A (vWA) domain